MIIINDEIQDNGIINLDSGFMFGRGLFETILVKKKPVLLEQHLDRLNNGLKKIGLNQVISEDYVIKNIEKLKCENCAIKIMVSEKNIIFTKREVPYDNKAYIKGFSLVISDMKRNPYSHMTYLKSFNYADNIIEREKAKKNGFDEVLFLNTEGYVAEGSVSNIFLIKDNKIFTPSVESGLLSGIIRNFLIENLRENYDIKEKKISFEELINADEVFITNSLMGIMKVRSINSHSFERSEKIDEIKGFYDELIKSKEIK